MDNNGFKRGQEVFEVYSKRNDDDTKTIWTFRIREFENATRVSPDDCEGMIYCSFLDNKGYEYSHLKYIFESKEDAQKAIDDLNEKELYDSDYEVLITCPKCGATDEDSWEYGESDAEYQCGNCDEMLDLEVHITVSYSTKLKETKGKKNDKEK